MKEKIFRTLIIPALMFTFSATSVFSQVDYDEPPRGSNWRIKSVQAGDQNLGYWDQPGLITTLSFTPGHKISVYANDNGRDQIYYFVPAPEKGWYYIKSLNGNGCVDVPGSKTANGVQLIIYNSNNQNNQKFRFKHLGDSRWKIYAFNSKAVCLANRSHANDTAVHTWDDHDGPWMEWYIINSTDGYKYNPEMFAKKPANNVSTKYTLKDAIENSDVAKQYFNYVDAAKFNSENTNGDLQNYLNNINVPGDQWSAILNIISGTHYNKDTALRQSVYKILANLSVKKGSNFTENLIKGQVAKQINDYAASEKDSAAKGLLAKVAGKFK